MEVTILDNGVVYFDEQKGFFGGRAKAGSLKNNGLLKLIQEAKKVRGI